MRLFTLLGIVLPLMLAGCATKTDPADLTEAEHYRRAYTALEEDNYLDAIDKLQNVRSRFPYGEYAAQVQLDLIYAQYRSNDYAATIAAAQRFTRNYPDRPGRDYALYMKGLANFYLDQGLLGNLVPRDRAARDMQSGRDAFKAFKKLTQRFPDSRYAPDARSRMVYLRNGLAQHNIYIARYYARRGAEMAAAKRAQRVVTRYQQTPAVPEALAIMSRAYEELQQPLLADNSRRTLLLSWPQSPYLRDDGNAVDLEWWPEEGDKNLLSLLTFDAL